MNSEVKCEEWDAVAPLNLSCGTERGSDETSSSNLNPSQTETLSIKKEADPVNYDGLDNNRLIDSLILPGKDRLKCRMCDRIFSQLGNLKTHLRLHLGMKPFECPHCQKRYTQRGNMESHRIRCPMDPLRTVTPPPPPRYSRRRKDKPKEGYVSDFFFSPVPTLPTMPLNEAKVEVPLPPVPPMPKPTGDLIILGLKPFECPLCYKKFTQRSLLEDHLFWQHLSNPDNHETEISQPSNQAHFSNIQDTIDSSVPVQSEREPVQERELGQELELEQELEEELEAELEQELEQGLEQELEPEPESDDENSEENIVNLSSEPYSNESESEVEPEPTSILESESETEAEEENMIDEDTAEHDLVDSDNPDDMDELDNSDMNEGDDDMPLSGNESTSNNETLNPGDVGYNADGADGDGVVANAEAETEDDATIHDSRYDVDRLLMPGGDRLMCRFCKRHFSSISCLKVHLRLHLGLKPFHCPYCSMKFSQRGNMESHLYRYHKDQNPFSCSICGVRCSSKPGLKSHLRTHVDSKLFKCLYCEKEFISKGGLDYHLLTHDSEKTFECHLCGNKYYRSRELLNHLQFHTGEKQFQCQICNKAFSQAGNLKAHLRSHNGEKRYKCHLCSATFNQMLTLEVHVQRHLGNKPFKCVFCSKMYATKAGLEYHLRTPCAPNETPVV